MSTTQPIKNRKQLTEFRNYYKNYEYNPRNYALIVFGLNSALRIGDILSLRWRDVFHGKNGTYRKHVRLIEKKTGCRFRIFFAETTALCNVCMNLQSSIVIFLMTGCFSVSTVPLLSITGVSLQILSTTSIPLVTVPNAAY